jgi:hypothetical protein
LDFSAGGSVDFLPKGLKIGTVFGVELIESSLCDVLGGRELIKWSS